MPARALIKICGLTNQADLDAVVRLRFDFAGFIFAGASPRRVTPEHAATMHSQGIKRVGVFVEQRPEEILHIMRTARLDYAQLHGEHGPEVCAALAPYGVIKVFWPERYTDATALEEDMHRFAEYTDFFLLDAGQGGGGSGHSFAWKRVQTCAPPRPWFLAGGIAPENALAALALPLPHRVGLDVNSGVEIRPGEKDLQKLQQLYTLFNPCHEKRDAL